MEVAKVEEQAVVTHAWSEAIVDVQEKISAVRQLMSSVLEEGADYAVVPGTTKPSLTKVGAQSLCQLLNARPQPWVLDGSVRDFERPFFNYEVRVDLISLKTGEIIGSGLGSCNSHETRYRYRHADRACPKCGAGAILRSKFGTKGWYCFAKKGGCGAEFEPNDSAITSQDTGRQENLDVADQANTLLKMAEKRALVDAALNATGANRVFTQDMEDQPRKIAPVPAPEPPPVPSEYVRPAESVFEDAMLVHPDDGVDAKLASGELVTICSECDQPIGEITYKGRVFSSMDIVQRTTLSYRRPLCWGCAESIKVSMDIGGDV